MEQRHHQDGTVEHSRGLLAGSLPSAAVEPGDVGVLVDSGNAPNEVEEVKETREGSELSPLGSNDLSGYIWLEVEAKWLHF